jgi:hypothetical protein
MGPFQISGQQPQDTPISYGSVEAFEAGCKALPVHPRILHFVTATAGAGGAAALKYDPGNKIRGSYPMGLKEASGQKGDLRDPLYGLRVHAQGVRVETIEGVVLVLKAKNVQCPDGKILFTHPEYSFFLISRHTRFLEKAGRKSFVNDLQKLHKVALFTPKLGRFVNIQISIMKPPFFLIPVVLLTIALSSCSKSNSNSKPTLAIKSINTTVPVGGSLDAILQFNSSSGDLSEGTFVAIRNRLNQRPLSGNSASSDTVTGPIPEFPSVQKGQFEFTLDWATYLHQSDLENDTIVFKFAAVDANGNSSDTITSPQIVVLFQ